MTTTLDDLGATLVRLRVSGLRIGLKEAAAQRLVRALSDGEPVAAAAARSGLDRRVAAVAEGAEGGDLPAVLGRLVQIGAEVEAATVRLRSAGSYPLVLAAAVALAGITVIGRAFGALALLPGSTAGSPGVILGVLGVATLLLVVLGGLVVGRVRVPWLSAGWQLVDRFAFVQSLAILLDADTPLPRALRSSARWSGRSYRAAAEGLAASLEAGAPGEHARPLMDEHETAMLVAAAGSGTVREALIALGRQRRVALQRALPAAVVRIHAAAVMIAGAALLVVAGAYYWEYSHALFG